MNVVPTSASTHLQELTTVAERIGARVAPLAADARSFAEAGAAYDDEARAALADFTRLNVRVRPRHIRMYVLLEVARVLEVDLRDLLGFAGYLKPQETLAKVVARDVAGVENTIGAIRSNLHQPPQQWDPLPPAA